MNADEIMRALKSNAEVNHHAAVMMMAADLIESLTAENKRLKCRDKTAKYHVYKERCKDLTAQLAAKDAEIERLTEAQRWRDAETEPPKCYGNYIVEFYTGVISSAWFLTGGSWQVESEHYKSGISGVIRWMPLPAAPEKGARP